MESDPATPGEKKLINRAKSFSSGPLQKLNKDPAKNKSFNANDAVRSLDTAIGRLKKSKLVSGEYTSTTAHTSPVRHGVGSAHMFIDSLTEPNYSHGIDSLSAMSMNFSHYELMRNLSRSNCNLDGAFSSTTCNAYVSASDILSKNEHLEKYFRSLDVWSKDNDPGTSTAEPDSSDK